MTVENKLGKAESIITADQVTLQNVEKYLDQLRRAVGARTSDQIPVRRRPGMFN